MAVSFNLFLHGHAYLGSDPATQQSQADDQYASAEAVGGGVFLTVAHVIDEYRGQIGGKDAE